MELLFVSLLLPFLFDFILLAGLLEAIDKLLVGVTDDKELGLALPPVLVHVGIAVSFGLGYGFEFSFCAQRELSALVLLMASSSTSSVLPPEIFVTSKLKPISWSLLRLSLPTFTLFVRKNVQCE